MGGYLLGQTPTEADRLTRQAGLIAHETRTLFAAAGLVPGLRVLEIGSGAGDVAILAAALVAPHGSVLGIEGAEQSAELANRRIGEAGVPARVEVGNLDSYVPAENFDALVGRFVLAYLVDPPATLARLAAHVRPGGTVAFMEFDVREIGSDPEVPLLSELRRWIVAAYEVRGVPPGLGSSLGATFHAAGLPWPEMTSIQKASCGPGGLAWYFAELVRTLAPHIIEGGIATEAEMELPTLEARLSDAIAAAAATVYSPRWVSAWTRLPGP